MSYKQLEPGQPGADFTVAGSGAFRDCKWCKGRGCLSCKEEYEKEAARRAKPIFVANPDDPEEMREMNAVIGMRALEAAFGPEGGGAGDIEYNAAVQSLSRFLRTGTTRSTSEEEESK